MTTKKLIKRKIDLLKSFKQKAFVLEIKKQWINGKMNIGEAAIAARYSSRSVGSLLMKDEKIREAIGEELQKINEGCGITKEMILCEIKKLAFSNITNVAEWDEDGVRMKNSCDLPDWATASIQEIKESSIGKKKEKSLKMYDKQRALESLSKIFDLDNLGVGDEDEQEGIDALVSGFDGARKYLGIETDRPDEPDEYDVEEPDDNGEDGDDIPEENPDITSMEDEEIGDIGGFSEDEIKVLLKLKKSGMLKKLKGLI